MTIHYQRRLSWLLVLGMGLVLLNLPAHAQSRASTSGSNLPATMRLFGSADKQLDNEEGQPRSRSLALKPSDNFMWRDGNQEDSTVSGGADDLDDVVDEPLYKDFSRYIRSTSGKLVIDALPIKRSEGRAPKLPEGYVLGSGDQIEVQAWGSISAQYHLTVDDSGRVFIPDVGSVPIAGVKASDLSPVLTSHFKRLYKGFELRAVVSRARAITVYVAGQANSVGLKNVSASHTLLSATLGFARPSEGGSRRFVTFQRGKAAAQTIDLYCFFRQECPAFPEVLSDGDVIRVPARGKLVAVSGAVSRPGIYELAPDETVGDLLKYAGNLAVTADPQRVYFYSFGAKADASRQFKMMTVPKLCPDAGATSTCLGLSDGDYLDIQTKFSLVKGVVTVVTPGVDPVKVEFKSGIRLVDVVRSTIDKLIPDRIVQNLNSGGFKSLSDIDEKLRRLDLDSVTLYRIDRDGREYQTQRVSFAEANAQPSGAENIELQDGDILALEAESDFKTPRDKMVMTVQVLGEVNKPGRYRVSGKNSLGEVFKLAGGLGDSAASWSAVVLRQGTGKNAVNLEVLDRAFAAVQEYQTRQEQLETGKTVAPVQFRELGERATQSSIGAFNASLRSKVADLMEGRNIVYLSQTEGSGVDINLMRLNPDDIVIVPPQQDTFSCYGAVFKPGDFFVGIEGSLSAKDAVGRCGPIEEMGSNVYQFIARENRVCRRGWFSSCPDVRGGDMIVAVPESVTKQGSSVALQWLDVALRSLTALATIKVLAN